MHAIIAPNRYVNKENGAENEFHCHNANAKVNQLGAMLSLFEGQIEKSCFYYCSNYCCRVLGGNNENFWVTQPKELAVIVREVGFASFLLNS